MVLSKTAYPKTGTMTVSPCRHLPASLPVDSNKSDLSNPYHRSNNPTCSISGNIGNFEKKQLKIKVQLLANKARTQNENSQLNPLSFRRFQDIFRVEIE